MIPIEADYECRLYMAINKPKISYATRNSLRISKYSIVDIEYYYEKERNVFFIRRLAKFIDNKVFDNYR